MVYKELRHPRPRAELGLLCDLPAVVAAEDEARCRRVLCSSAWPVAAVVEDDEATVAVGVLIPRAPAEFWLRHRDGPRRLATLSYLAADPDRMAVAYGVTLPQPGTPERVALVYALARLLDAWQGGPGPLVVHGDLSAKNVLWSLSPAPAVYVLDCDGVVIADAAAGPGPEAGAEPGPDAGAGPGLGPAASSLLPHGRRATTPNWDDPALPPGARPSGASDRYALGLAFLRLVGAAHFPLQGRQRAHERVNVDLELPRSWRRLADMPGLWELCERSLSVVDAAERPLPAQWAAALEDLLDVLGGAELAARARAAQGDERPARSPGRACGAGLQGRPGLPGAGLENAGLGGAGLGPSARMAASVPDVVVRPVLRHRAVATWQLIGPAPALSGTGAGGRGPALSGVAALTPRQMARRTLTTWAAAHGLAARLVRRPGRRLHGLRRLTGVLALDAAAACVVLFLVGMVVSPWIGL
jgi:hypothetical protein